MQPRRRTRASSPVGFVVPIGAHRRRTRGATMKAARQGLRLTPGSPPRGCPCAGGKSQIQQKRLVDHISRPWILRLRQPVVDIVEGAGIFEGMRSEGLLLGDYLLISTGDQDSPADR